MTEQTTAVAARETRALTIGEIKEQIATIHSVLKSAMKEKTHYDVIPGCGDKKVLLKPGAEKILATFHIGIEINAEDLGDGFDHRYRITCRGFYIPTGNTIGYGIGECSTSEKKYKWREAVCQEEYDATPETRRNKLWKKDYNSKKVTEVLQVRQNPSDIANTVLKMAKKRAMVDLCLTATACSDMFVQDIDDPDTAEVAGVNTAKRYQKPQQKAAAPQHQESDGEVISEAQAKRLYFIGKQKNLSNEEMSFIVYDKAGVNKSNEIPRDKYNEVCAAFEAAKPGEVMPKEAN